MLPQEFRGDGPTTPHKNRLGTMRGAADFDDAAFEQCLVAREVVADELASPVSQEVAGIEPFATVGKVIDHGLQRLVFAGAVAPQIGPMCAAQPGRQHRHRGLIRMQYRLGQQPHFQCIHQRLQLHAAGTDPLRQRRARYRDPCTLEDAFLAVERAMIQVFGDQHVHQQGDGRDALVDDVRGHRRLDQRLAAAADPLAADMTLDREYPWGVIELLADVLPDALQAAAAGALGALGFVCDVTPREGCRQRQPARL